VFFLVCFWIASGGDGCATRFSKPSAPCFRSAPDGCGDGGYEGYEMEAVWWRGVDVKVLDLVLRVYGCVIGCLCWAYLQIPFQ
jgi:hypothetical protein